MEENTKNHKQWLASVKYPTDYIKPEINSEKAPKVRLTKEHVFGFRSKDTRRNLKYLNQKEFMYATGAWSSFKNYQKIKQDRNNLHREYLTSILTM
jgi:hypothetical protein